MLIDSTSAPLGHKQRLQYISIIYTLQVANFTKEYYLHLQDHYLIPSREYDTRNQTNHTRTNVLDSTGRPSRSSPVWIQNK